MKEQSSQFSDLLLPKAKELLKPFRDVEDEYGPFISGQASVHTGLSSKMAAHLYDSFCFITFMCL